MEKEPKPKPEEINQKKETDSPESEKSAETKAKALEKLAEKVSDSLSAGYATEESFSLFRKGAKLITDGILEGVPHKVCVGGTPGNYKYEVRKTGFYEDILPSFIPSLLGFLGIDRFNQGFWDFYEQCKEKYNKTPAAKKVGDNPFDEAKIGVHIKNYYNGKGKMLEKDNFAGLTEGKRIDILRNSNPELLGWIYYLMGYYLKEKENEARGLGWGEFKGLPTAQDTDFKNYAPAELLTRIDEWNKEGEAIRFGKEGEVDAVTAGRIFTKQRENYFLIVEDVLLCIAEKMKNDYFSKEGK